MTSAKEIEVRPIAKRDADALIKRVHYSGKVVRNSHAIARRLPARQAGGRDAIRPAACRSRTSSDLVRDTGWNGFLELNRLAFTDVLPRNSESRALGIALRMIRKHYPHIEWIVSFADACQCGDGTIYRAAGFILTAIKINKDLHIAEDGSVVHKMSQITGSNRLQHFAATGGRWRGTGTPLEGYTLRYIYFLNPAARSRLIGEELPFSAIQARGATMYRGVRGKQAMAGTTQNSDGAAPIPTLQRTERGLKMKPGKRPLPTHLKLLRGNPGQRRLPDEPQPEQLPDVPEPPPFITGYAADEWWITGTELHRLGLLTKVDVPALAAIATASANGAWPPKRWRGCRRAIR